MRIAMVTGQYRPGSPWSDPAARAVDLARALEELGHHLTLYARVDGAAEQTDGVVLHRLPVGPPHVLDSEELLAWVPQLAEALLKEWSNDTPELVHTFGLEAGLAARIAGRDLPEAPMVHERITTGPYDHEHPVVAAGERLHRLRAALARSADSLVARYPEEVLALRRLGADRRRIALIPQGVDTGLFTPADDPLPRSGPPWRVACLDGTRSAHTVTEAVTQLPETTLTMLGTGPDTTVAHEAIPELLRGCDVLASVPPHAESGTAALEAMACGLAVVASDGGALRDVVVDGVTGLLVPPGHPGRLAQALRELLHDPAQRQALGIAGLDRARVRHAWPHIAVATDLMYQQLSV